MQNRLRSALCALLLSICLLQDVSANGQPPGGSSTLFSYNFDQSPFWADKPTPGSGTIDIAGGKEGSAGMIASMQQPTKATLLVSGPLPVSNTETNLGKLTLSFSLSVTSPRPIVLLVESFDAQRHHSGALESEVYPAAANCFQRFAVDLSSFKPVGTGIFNPCDPFLGMTLKANNESSPTSDSPWEMRLDNVHYARPAFYISPHGDDRYNGVSELTALATVQKAVDLAQPGDIILVREGVYTSVVREKSNAPLVDFVRPGTSARWITLKNYPGESPVLSSSGQVAIRIMHGAPPATQPLAYIEVRGLHIRGNGDTAREQFPQEIGKSTPNTDSMGISVFGRQVMVHHVRIADNLVDYCTSDGVYIDSADWICVEHNSILNNCWTTIGYAPAGLAIMKYANFDGSDNSHRMLLCANRVTGNRLFVKNSPWGQEKKTGYYNGNGILIDANAEKPPAVNSGRTLVQNNLVFNNGGGGIQMWGNHRIDLVNNTVYCNGTVNNWGQMGFERCNDVRLINNIIVAPHDRPLDSWFAKPDRATANILRDSNLYFGGSKPPVAGNKVLIADPQFLHASTDQQPADFHPSASSPASGAGRWDSFIPIVDIDGNIRPRNHSPTLGAYQ